MQKKYHLNYRFSDQPVLYNDTHLIQIGRRHCAPDEIIEKHAHIDWYELTIAIEGKGTVITNDKAESISKGDIYLSIPGDFHEIISSNDAPLKYDFISFKSDNSTIKKELRKIVSDTYFCDLRVFRDDAILSAVSLAISEISSKKKYYIEILSSTLDQLLYLMLRNFDKNKVNHKTKSINAADELCFQIMHYIDTHIYSITNLADLSHVFRFNYSYLSKLFKSTTGKTISDYYQTRRLDMAQLLIIENKLKIRQIAETLNYSSLYSFSKAFKNKYGISPSHYSSICLQEHTSSVKTKNNT